MRPSTSAASATQQELIQGPIQQPSGSQLSTDFGRETARQLRENANPNTRFIDKPTPSTDKNLLRQAAGRQQSMVRDAQQQAFGNRTVPQVKLEGRYAAPSVPTSNLVFKGGGVRFQPAMRGNLLTAVAGVAAELLVEPAADAISDYVIHPMIGAVLGKDIPSAEELRRIQTMKKEIELRDALNERLYQQKLNEAQLPIIEGEAPLAPVLPERALYASTAAPSPYPHRSSKVNLGSSQSHLSGASKTHSRSEVDPNREYKIRRAALGDNPTKEEVDAVVAYGLAQHRKNFPNLYSE
ncbi:hypothetical protein [Synechococcus sp. WH 8016]|uniref:hypothetical protein n=1 Tax=Synechococcus sp. WH 8016 TaxID=166318 RepID=UPI000237D709|nr:hypothetical protein [Synechococcus sp. WH 8016]EHA61893.1 hypothetical protein Syn8016DRAFT_1965 [Synechococcus sp. WH 8016]